VRTNRTRGVLRRPLGLPCLLSISFLNCLAPAHAIEPLDIESDLAITVDGRMRHAGIDEAMALLNVPSLSLALIDEGRIALARAYGAGATPDTLYQAASLSKFVTAVGAMRLIEAGQLILDEDVNDRLTSWRVPANAFDKDHAVTLRGLLSMTGGIRVPGFAGYAAGAPRP
jgi:CubicO group peptidase (beta-lactamase class C family)